MVIFTFRASVASSYMDDDDDNSDTTSCNDDDDPMSYDVYMQSRRSEYPDGTIASQKSRQSVDFIDPGLYNSLARK